jgi:hypothetical protein
MPGVREPAVAGRFYEASSEALRASLRDCFLHQLGPGALPKVAAEHRGSISALVSPHAGYMFSGPAAANGFSLLAADGVPEIAVILGPSHYSAERQAAISTAASWRTPLGQVAVDTDLTRQLTSICPLLAADESPHRFEHSLEVQIPFLQYIYGDRVPAICPICIRSHPSLPPASAGRAGTSPRQVGADAQQIGEALATTLSGRRAVVIASTDFSHHLPHAVAQRQDRLALDPILALDPQRLLQTVVAHSISMCGPVPVAIALHFCLARGPHQAELLRYYTSGDIIGDRDAVVGYASVAIRRSPPTR